MSINIDNSNDSLSHTKEQLEIEILRWQTSKKSKVIESIKAIASLTGVIAGIIAILSLGFSIFQYNINLSENRKNRIEERLDNALNRIGNENSLQRLGGIVSLRSFVNSENPIRNSQVILSLTNSLAIEKEPIVRASILGTLKSISLNTSTKESLNEALVSLVELNRITVEKGNLRTNRISLDSTNYDQINDLKPASYESYAIDLSKGILILLRKGIRIKDLSEIYCVNGDFSNLDLSGVNFDYSILDGSSFSNCNLNNSSFKSADIENVSFKASKLRYADFSFEYEEQIRHTIKSYVERRIDWSILYSKNKFFTFKGPDFSYADLSYAKFDHHPLLYLSSSDTKSYNHYAVHPALFVNAILDSTNFIGIQSYGISKSDVNVPFHGRNFKWTKERILKDGRNINILRVADQKNLIMGIEKGEFKQFKNSLDQLADCFMGSKWQDAKLPESLRYFLESKKNINLLTQQ